MALAARPPLTSVDMNLRALGREAGDRLLEMIDGRARRRRRAPAVLAGGATVVGGGRDRSMSQFTPVRFVDVQIEGDVLARAARNRADPHHPEPACPARRPRHPRLPDAPRPAAAAALPAQRARLHGAGLLGLRRRQVDRGRVLRPVAPPRRRHRGEDRGDRRRPRTRPGPGRLPQLLVSRPRARQALDQPPRQPRALQPRPPAGRRHRLLPRHRPPPPARHPRALRRPRPRDLRPEPRPEARL